MFEGDHTGMKIRLINLVLCILIVVVIIGQFVFMLQPYINYTPKISKFELSKGAKEVPQNFSLMEVVWMDYSKIEKEYFVPKLEEADMIHVYNKYGKEVDRPTEIQKLDAVGEMSNGFVMGIVGMNVLGLVVLIMTIFTRKSLVQYLFTLAWAACSMFAFFTENYMLQKLGIAHATDVVLPAFKYLAIAALALTLLRGFPWFYSRYLHKEAIDLEALNA